MEISNNIMMNLPGKIVFGTGCASRLAHDFPLTGRRRLFVLAVDEVLPYIGDILEKIKDSGTGLEICTDIKGEPSTSDYLQVYRKVCEFNADSIAGIGGGSVLDSAKLLSLTAGSHLDYRKITPGNNRLKRELYLACLPTTAGTGSEVSPNAIFFDIESGQKKAFIHPELVPDAVYVDPLLAAGVPPYVTAYTGMDAFTHCMEAYVNRNAHPVTDLFALEGMRLIGCNLEAAVAGGNNTEARSSMALASLYGGMCLGPVNTAAVHALAYPLAGMFRIPHGISVSVMLPYVMEYNADFATERLAGVAASLGVTGRKNLKVKAKLGIERIRRMIDYCGLPSNLMQLGIPREAISEMVTSAFGIQRLLQNNVCELRGEHIQHIYMKAYE